MRAGIFESLAGLMSALAFSRMADSELKQTDLPAVYVKRIEDAVIENLMAKVYAAKNGTKAKEDAINKVLEIRPRHVEALAALAWNFYHLKLYSRSLDGFQRLFKSSKSRNAAQGADYSLSAMGLADEAKQFAIKHHLKKQLKESLEKELLEADDEDKPAIAEQILALDGRHAWSLTITAWFYYRQDAFEKAYDQFVQITQMPTKKAKEKAEILAAWEGRLLSLIGAANWGGAGRDVDRSPFTDREKQQWRTKIRLNQARHAFSEREYEQAKEMLSGFSKLATADAQMLAWCHHYLGDSETALHAFAREHRVRPSASTAEGVLRMLFETGRYRSYQTLIDTLINSHQAKYQQVAAQTVLLQHPQMAAQYLPTDLIGPLVTRQWSDPSLDVNVRYSEQSGSAGTAKLNRRVTSLWLNGPWYKRWNGTLVLYDEHLTPGQIKEANFGREYLANTANEQWTQSHWDVQTPQLRINYAGRRHEAHAIVGTTAQGGPVKSVPAWRLALRWETLRVDGFRIPRTDSQLAYIGMHDPYDAHGAAWGRVMETGISASKNVTLSGPFWFGLAAKAAEQQGQNTRVNQERLLDFSYGMTKQRWDLTVTQGLFLGLQQHSHDSGNYTYGQSGIYSPNSNMTLGAIFNLESLTRSPKWWQLGLSAVYYQSDSKDAPLCPLSDRPEISVGEKGDGFAYRAAGRWHYSTGRHIKWYAAGEWTVAGDYQVWQAMLGLQWYFSGRLNVGLPDAPTKIWEPRWSERP